MKIRYCGICGSDIHFWEESIQPSYPYIPGHEFIGEVAEAGEDALASRKLKIGDQIAVEMIVPCHKCRWCKEGLYNLCIHDDKSVSPDYGVEYGCNISITKPPTPLWGGYSQFLYVPSDAIVHKFFKKVDWKESALIEPLAVSCRAVDQADLSANDTVAVIGPGTIGLTTVVTAKATRANPIILIGTKDFRLKVGRDLGANYAVNIHNEDPIKKVMELTNRMGVDAVFETAGTQSAQQLAFKLTRKGGKIILVGLSGKKDLTIIPDTDILYKELTVRGSFLSAHAYRPAMKIIQSGKFPLKKMITHIYPLEDINRAYELITKKEDNVIKVLLDPWIE
jgi:threonine dehydrogenase-like Zn-dependent dehydrogenase